MQNNSNKLNKIIMGTVLTSSAVMFAMGVNAIKPNLRVYAGSNQTSISISNSSFESSSYDAYNWTKLKDTTTDVIAKVVDTKNFENKKEDYKISVNPGKVASSSDDNVFMINSVDNFVSYGYSSNQFTLDANGYYIITVNVKTQSGGAASVYLTDENNFKLSHKNINSNGGYTEYKFFVMPKETLNVKLHLYLGGETFTSSGAVFFDEITAYSYSEKAFYSNFETRNQERSTQNFDENYWYNTQHEWQIDDNAILERISEDGSNASASGFIQKVYSLDNLPENVENPTDGNLVNNSNALLLVNPTEASVGVRLKGNYVIDFDTYDYVMLSTYVKTNTKSGGLTIKLSTKDKDDKYVAYEDALKNIQTSTSSSDKNNGWEKVSFAVKTSAFKQKEVYIEFWLGNETEKAEGYAFVGKLCYTTLTSEEYTNLSTSSTLAKVELDNFESESDDTNFKNAYFNNFLKSSEYDYNFKKTFIEASNLTKQDSNNVEYGKWNGQSVASGIINTNKDVFDSIGYPFANPGLTPNQAHSDIATQTNNVFAIYQNSNIYQEYKTDSIELKENSYYKLTIYVKTNVVDGGAKWALYSDGILLSEFKNIQSNSKWTTLTAYVKTGAKNYSDIYAVIGLGTKDETCTGTAFFDDMIVSSIEEDVFKAVTNTNIVNIVDLETDSFNLINEKQTNGLYESANWETDQTSENFIGGVMDTTNVSQAYLNNYNMKNPFTPANNNNVLVVNNREDLISTYTNKIKYTLVADSYYKISVWVKTYELSQSNLNLNYNDEKKTQAIPYGATIYIDNIAEKFEGITDTEWTKYTFFVNSSDEIEMTMHLGLGYEDAKTSGYAYFADISVEKLEEDAYTVQTASYDKDNLPKTVKLVSSAEKKEDDKESEESNSSSASNFNYLIIPTLITALALVIAIVGTILRQINFNKFVKLKKKTNSYDKRKIKTKTVRNAEIQNIVNEKLKELTGKLKELETNKAKLENDVLSYKEEYTKYKNKKLSKEEKKNKKIAKQNYYTTYNNLITTNQDITTLKDDIKKIKSDKYVLKEEYNLMKKTWKEEKQAQKLEKRNSKSKKTK